MGNIVAIVAIVLAVITAGCIGYIAWELTAEDKDAEKTGEATPPEKDEAS